MFQIDRKKWEKSSNRDKNNNRKLASNTDPYSARAKRSRVSRISPLFEYSEFLKSWNSENREHAVKRTKPKDGKAKFSEKCFCAVFTYELLFLKMLWIFLTLLVSLHTRTEFYLNITSTVLTNRETNHREQSVSRWTPYNPLQTLFNNRNSFHQIHHFSLLLKYKYI